MIAPKIETTRLTLAPLRRDLFDQHFATMSDPRVMAHIGNGEPQSRNESWRRFAFGAGQWPLMGYGYWAILDRTSGRLAGIGGLGEFERGIAELVGFPEFGYAFAVEYWGRGFATEFLTAAVLWADANLDATETRLIVDPANIASIRVAEKAGFEPMHEVENELGVSLLFRRPAASA